MKTDVFENVHNPSTITTLHMLAIVLGLATLVMATVGIVGTLFENFYITIVVNMQ